MGINTGNSSIDYDKVSYVYDTSRMANAESIDKLLRILRISSNSMVLDLGCGTGNYTSILQQTAKAVVGIDQSRGMLHQARCKCKSPLVQGDITYLPFANMIFDGAFAIQVLHHVKQKEQFLCDVYRVLHKGATFAIDSCSHRQMRTFWLYRYWPKGLNLDLARIPDTKEIASRLMRAGFSDIGMEVSYADIAAEHEKPERYLDKSYRDGQSTFQLLSEDEVVQGCRKLKKEIASEIVYQFIGQYEKQEARFGGSCIVYGRKSKR